MAGPEVFILRTKACIIEYREYGLKSIEVSTQEQISHSFRWEMRTEALSGEHCVNRRGPLPFTCLGYLIAKNIERVVESDE